MGHPHKYGVVLDAGSSGTRIHIYKWDETNYARKHATIESEKRLPQIETKKHWAMKTKPGVSTFGSKPYQVGEYLEPLLDHAKEIIPADSIPDTPLFLLATAGVRLLKPTEQKVLLQQICSYMRSHTKFLLPDCNLHVQVISGETEGLYGWIAANYLLGGFDNVVDHGKGHHTYGFLDMGGASAQIAFAPNATEAKKHAADLKLLRLRTLDGHAMEHNVFVTTWLGFGMNVARETYVKNLVEASGGPGIKELPDPCMPKGVTTTLDGNDDLKKKKGKDPVLVGTGLFEECLRQTYPLLQKDVPCLDSPCLLKGVHVPGIDFSVNHFVGVSEYWHTTHEIFDFGEDDPYDYTEYQKRVKEFCSMEWSEIAKGVKSGRWGKKVDKEKARQVCFKASWLTNIMHNGIGIPRVGVDEIPSHNLTDAGRAHEEAVKKGFLDPFQAVDKINGVELSWTLGKIVLYAASQIPAAIGQAALPVGFGSNTVSTASSGVPPDWQHAGSAITPPPPQTATKVNGTGENWQDEVALEGKTGNGPSGFLVLMLIMGLVLFFFIGRERRMRLYRRCGNLVAETAIKIRSSIFRRRKGSGVVYERLMEEGGLMVSGNGGVEFSEFEFGGLSDETESFSDSSSSGGSKEGKWRYGGGGGGGGGGIGGKAASKAQTRAGSTGLMVRIDSRERIARSRDVSPAGLRGARRTSD
ncbi:nucleoside phosphatase family-domain-containing protein [Kalaharituber pfeilii]|nr:nucleoside phosphatase family-domain-containing protein [Kalaharituber pfeilii]